MQLKHKGIQHSREFQQVRKKLDQLHKLEEDLYMKFSNTFPRWCVPQGRSHPINLAVEQVLSFFCASQQISMARAQPSARESIPTGCWWWANDDANCFPMPNCSLENECSEHLVYMMLRTLVFQRTVYSALIQNANHVQKQHGACQKVGIFAAQQDCCDGSMVAKELR